MVRYLGGAVAGLAVLAGLAILIAVPEPPKSAQVAEAAKAAAAVAPDGRRRAHDRKAEGREERLATAATRKAERARASHMTEVTSAKAERAPKVPDDDARAEIRLETREDLVNDLLDRVGAHAAKARWDDDLLADIELVVVDTTDAIGTRLADVDAGRASWEDVKRDVRQLRLDQANQVRELLGPDAFKAFVGDMDFDRFEGSEPVRGRL